MFNEKGFTTIEVAASLLVFGLIAVAAIIPVILSFSTLGDGTHSGYVTAVDQRGILFPNYEVYFKTDTSSSQEDTYCVHRSNPELADKLRSASRSSEKVTVTYKGVRGVGLGLCRGAEITGVD